MPIRPENRAKYPADWKLISERIRFTRAGNCCEWCGVRNGSIRVSRWGNTNIVLTVAHLDHDPANCADDNLAALCQRCHLGYDAGHHADTRRAIHSPHTKDLFNDESD